MKTLLQIRSSIFGESGQSSRLADAFVAAWAEQNPGARVIVRDLSTDPVPHITAERFGALGKKPEERTPGEREVAAYSDALVAELKAADVIALGLPMYNFGVPSTLKAYFDHVARAGVTFRYTQDGPEGLLKGKRAYVFAARGGEYAGSALDTQTDYVRNFFGFLGVEEIEFVYAEGLAVGEDEKRAALSKAREAIAGIAAGLSAAA